MTLGASSAGAGRFKQRFKLWITKRNSGVAENSLLRVTQGLQPRTFPRSRTSLQPGMSAIADKGLRQPNFKFDRGLWRVDAE
jgi:hypothetical protein